MGFSLPGFVHGIPQAIILEWVAVPSPGDLPNPWIKSRFPTLQADSLPAEPQGKPKNTGVGSLSLLQWIFLTQESNQDLLHCRRILYQLSHQGSPLNSIYNIKYTANSNLDIAEDLVNWGTDLEIIQNGAQRNKTRRHTKEGSEEHIEGKMR